MMNYKTKHEQNPAFPVNYPKNHPGTTSMNEAPNRPPKYPAFKLNFPIMGMPKPNQLWREIVVASGFVLRHPTFGGVVSTTFPKMVTKLIAKILLPLLMLFNKPLEIIIGKFDEMSGDFYRFMEYFFFMDEDVLIPIAVEVNDKGVVNRARIKSSSRSEGSGFFRFDMPRHFQNATDSVRPVADLLSRSIPGICNTQRSLPIKRILPSLKKLFVATLDIFALVKTPFLLFYKTIAKLPFETISLRLSAIKTLFKFPLSERLLIFMDSMMMGEYGQNNFARDK